MTARVEAGYGEPLAVGLQRPLGAQRANVMRCCGGLTAIAEGIPVYLHAAGCREGRSAR